MQKILFLAGLLLTSATVLGQPFEDPSDVLRTCVRQAASPIDVIDCERQATAGLQRHIKRLDQTILGMLGDRRRAVFERNRAAWREYADSARKMSAVALKARGDDLGSPLLVGATNQLLEQRIDELKDYLTSLKQ